MKLKLKVGLLALALVTLAAVSTIDGTGVEARALKQIDPAPNVPIDTFAHNVGNFGNTVYNINCIGSGDVSPNGEWPLGSGSEYMYTSSLWFGNATTVVHVYFAQNEIEWRPKSPIFESDAGTVLPFPTSYGVQDGMDFSWMSGYWRTPAPSRVSDQDGLWFSSDESSPIQFGLQVVAQSMGWSAPGHDEWLTIVFFMRYVGASPLDADTYLAFATDEDIGGNGNHLNDVAQFDGNNYYLDDANEWGHGDYYNNLTWVAGADGIPDEYDALNYPMAVDGEANQPYYDFFQGDSAPRMMSYMHDAQSGTNYPGFEGVRMLRVCINPGADITSASPEREYIVSSQHSWDINNDPENDGYKFAYMVDVGTFEEIFTEYDWRICPAVGPFIMTDGSGIQPGDVIEFIYCLVIGNGRNGMRQNADQALADALGFNGKFDDPAQGDEVDDFVVLSPPKSALLSGLVEDGYVTLHWDPLVALDQNIELLPDSSSGNQIDFEGYRIYRAKTLDQLGDSADLKPWFADDHEGDTPPVYMRDCLAQWDKDVNDPSHWTDGGEYWKAPGYLGNDNDQWPEYNTLNNWTAIFEDKYDGEGYAPGTGDRIYEFVDDGTLYHDWDKSEDDVDVPRPLAPRNHFTYYYSVVSYDYGASPLYNSNIGEDPYPSLEGGVRANYVQVTLHTMPKQDLENVLVVPNPYVGGVDWQTRSVTGIVERKMAFTNLPSRCTIRIYTISGDLVDIIEHNDPTSGTAWWDLQSRNNMEVTSGVYVYHIDAPGIGTKIGKLAVLMGERL